MPKAPSTTSSFAAQVPQPLKRNQACHQCRRRKLKCDAKRPACSTCIRSHAHAVSHAPPGTQTQLPPEPECTFDDVVDPPVLTEMSKTQKLESRIQELESLLLEKDFKSTTSSPPPSMQDNLGNDMDILASALTQSPAFDIPVMATPSDDSPKSATGLEMIWANYPPGIPNVELLRHLVEVFFVFHPHAKRIIHYPSFMAALSLSPNHPKFPIAPVLHAICALGALYTAAVTSPPLPDFSAESPDEIFTHRQRLREGRPDSFAEQQAKYARDTADEIEAVGDRLLEVMQARTILTWFYWSHSRWLEVFISSAHCLRTAVPLGLNVCPPFHSITHSHRPASILSPAPTVIDDETRRNLFWLAYCTERLHGCSNGWAMSMDDQDVSQLLPVRGDHFEKGVLVTPHHRQWAQTRDVIVVHPEDQTDSFVLWVKGTMIISRAKTFNTRFRSKFHFGDASVMSPHTEPNNPLEPVDPRGSPAFTEIDSIATTFRSTFPAHLRNPISNNVVDQHLYVACLMPLVATIILHDPHAEVRRSGCVSALRIVTAARSILDLAYEVCSTSFDVTLLDPFCSFCWFLAGRVLIRFLQAALDVNNTEQVSTLRAELEFLQSAIMRIGQRVPLALRYGKMLGDLITKRCGPVDPTQTAHTPLTFPRAASVQDDDVDIWFEQPGHSLHESLGMQSVPSYMTVGNPHSQKTIMAAPSMAAALAASLPAPTAAPAPAAPVYEAIPASMAKVIDIEAEISLQVVQLDGMVVSKILKHSRDATSGTVHGLLLGLDLDGTLEVSNSFALPHHVSDEDEKSAKSSARYQASMLRSLREVQADDSVVGFYQAINLGAFFNQSLVEIQALHQDKLRHGGIVVVHDVSLTARGNASFRAFRLTSAFLDAYKKSNFSTTSLVNHRLTFSAILEEIPLQVRVNPLLGSFLNTLTKSSPSTLPEASPDAARTSVVPPAFAALDLRASGLTRNLEQIIETVDSYRNEEGNVAFLQRQIARERAKAENYMAKRKEENLARAAQDLAPLPEEDVTRLFKIPPEPSRLESMLLLGQIDAYAKKVVYL
uniref:Eukaryotic translation initiation factor 3 subunit H n=1 Tax=Mycena chlorophos TaxID=658473 RepID=A0ABQ0KWH5_MYCCL|nr:predicted protein [Mycena chlorophos]